ASRNDDRERDNDANAGHRAFCHYRCVAGENANWQRAIALFLSVVRDPERRRQHWRRRHVMLLHKLGPMDDDAVRHRRKLRREPILPRATRAVVAPFGGEAAPSPAGARGRFERWHLTSSAGPCRR